MRNVIIKQQRKRIYPSTFFSKLYQFIYKDYHYNTKWFVTYEDIDGSIVSVRTKDYDEALKLKQTLL